MSDNFVEIDASNGGQMFRTALALSAVSLKPVKIVNIKKNREKQGLQPQHLATLNTLAKLTNAVVVGNILNSTEVEFSPKRIAGGRFSVNIGTAGSSSLLLQALLLPSLFADSINLTVTGGTDVPFAPKIQSLKFVLFPLLSKMNARFKIEIKRHGFMPKGNGLIVFSSFNSVLPLRPLNFSKFSDLSSIRFFSNSNDLPREVSLNQVRSAKRVLEKEISFDFVSEISSTHNGNGKGSSIVIIGKLKNGSFIHADALGERNLSAVKVGEIAAKNFLEEFLAKKPIDSHIADQLIPFLAIASGTSEIAITKLTEHTLSNIGVVESFLPAKFKVSGELNKPASIVVQGIALKK